MAAVYACSFGKTLCAFDPRNQIGFSWCGSFLMLIAIDLIGIEDLIKPHCRDVDFLILAACIFFGLG